MRVALTGLGVLLAFTAMVHAQVPASASLRIRSDVPSRFSVHRPDGSTVRVDVDVRGLIADWWIGPGEYSIRSSLWGTPAVASFHADGPDAFVVASRDHDQLVLSIHTRETAVSARVTESGVGVWPRIEIRNDTDQELSFLTQDGFLHYEVDPVVVDPAWTPSERDAHTGTTADLRCGTGLHMTAIAAHTRLALPLIDATNAVSIPGRYRGTVLMTADDGHPVFVNFDFGLVRPPGATRPRELLFEP